MSSLDDAKKNFPQITQAPIPAQGGPLLEDDALAFVFGKVWSSHLSYREKRLITLACAAMTGHTMPLESHIYAALKSGDLNMADLQAFQLHVAAYGGFPVASSVGASIHKVASNMPK